MGIFGEPGMDITLSTGDAVTLGVFAATLAATFFAAWLGGRRGGADHDGLADEKLNRWLVGLSAGAAANSGFIVTGAVGLGYVGGMTWLLLPLGWLVGDLVFWSVFPQRINSFGRAARVTTLSQLITHGVRGAQGLTLSLLTAGLVVLCLSGYLAAQWLAGQKFLAGAFDLGGLAALACFALLIVTYTAIGGFRGSVYVDSLQAVIRLVGTGVALGAVLAAAAAQPDYEANIRAAGPGFLSLLGQGSVGAAIGVALGFAAASLGFGLAQPQIISRYLAGASPGETRSAWWIYMGFVQFTWIAMTLFGVYLRGVMPGLSDPETGLSRFFQAKVDPLLTGVILADVFATIAATSNALLVAVGQSVAHDLGPRLLRREKPLPLAPICILLGLATMGASLLVHASVLQLALWSVTLIGGGLAPAVMARVLGWPHTALSMIVAMIGGAAVTVAWRMAGLQTLCSEALPAMATGVALNFFVARLSGRRGQDIVR